MARRGLWLVGSMLVMLLMAGCFGLGKPVGQDTKTLNEVRQAVVNLLESLDSNDVGVFGTSTTEDFELTIDANAIFGADMGDFTATHTRAEIMADMDDDPDDSYWPNKGLVKGSDKVVLSNDKGSAVVTGRVAFGASSPNATMFYHYDVRFSVKKVGERWQVSSGELALPEADPKNPPSVSMKFRFDPVHQNGEYAPSDRICLELTNSGGPGWLVGEATYFINDVEEYVDEDVGMPLLAGLQIVECAELGSGLLSDLDLVNGRHKVKFELFFGVDEDDIDNWQSLVEVIEFTLVNAIF